MKWNDCDDRLRFHVYYSIYIFVGLIELNKV